jgi:hypothetical protein
MSALKDCKQYVLFQYCQTEVLYRPAKHVLTGYISQILGSFRKVLMIKTEQELPGYGLTRKCFM